MTALLYLRETSITDTARQSLYLFIDVFLPYYVISRSTKNLNNFRDTLTSFVIAAMLLSTIAIFESYKHWLLYNSLVAEMDLSGGIAGYIGRADSLRAVASTGQPIVLGYVIAVALGFYLYLRPTIKGSLFLKLGLMLLLVGLISPLSRGPWVGAAVLLIVYIATGASALKRLVIVGMMAVMAVPILAILPGGEKIIDLLPFVGTVDQANVDYRQDLFRNSIIVIRKNLWLGSPNYMDSPEMLSMMQGQGIVDVVNTYIRITLESGLVGLGLYAGFIMVVLRGIRNGMKKVKDRNSEIYLLGRVLLATIIAIVVIIFSVSSITFIPIVYWSVAALGVAYSQLIKNYLNTLKAADE
jgi:O-antigen ligase